MKQLIRRLSRVADSSSYQPLLKFESEEDLPTAATTEGHVPVYVGEEMVRFEVPASAVSQPAFVALLQASAIEYGYEQRGVLRIPCPVPLFRRVLEALINPRSAAAASDRQAIDELVRSLCTTANPAAAAAPVVDS